jgi:hypothetical protein
MAMGIEDGQLTIDRWVCSLCEICRGITEIDHPQFPVLLSIPGNFHEPYRKTKYIWEIADL